MSRGRLLPAMIHREARFFAASNRESHSKATLFLMSRTLSEGKRGVTQSGTPWRIKSVTCGGPCLATQIHNLGSLMNEQWPGSTRSRWCKIPEAIPRILKYMWRSLP